MKIRLNVERLVLEGLPVEDPNILRHALERELTSRLVEGGLSAELSPHSAVPSVRGGNVALRQGSNAARLGTQIAGAVYGGIGARK